jgi:hypothetical protein
VDLPEECVSSTLIFTEGFSIENDVFRDGKLDNFMSPSERAAFAKEMRIVVDCFALAAARVLARKECKTAAHPNEILDDQARRAALLALEDGEQYPTAFRDLILSDYKKCLRGKTLMGLLMRQLSYPRRVVRHNPRALLDMVANNRGPLLIDIFSRIEAIFA